jgi:hemerythrin superfamily protein
MDAPTSPAILLAHDHLRLERLFTELREAFEADARDDVQALWTELDTDLRAHLEAEERHALPRFAELHPDEAATLRAEHDAIRTKLDELDVMVDLHTLRADAAGDFLDLLRAHAAREEKLLYRWVEEKAATAAEHLLDGARARLGRARS